MRWLAFFFCLIASPAFSQACMPSSVMEQRLRDEFGERLLFAGLANETQIIEIWGNDLKGTWTAVSKRANGISCVVHEGYAIAVINPAGKRS